MDIEYPEFYAVKRAREFALQQKIEMQRLMNCSAKLAQSEQGLINQGMGNFNLYYPPLCPFCGK